MPDLDVAQFDKFFTTTEVPAPVTPAPVAKPVLDAPPPEGKPGEAAPPAQGSAPKIPEPEQGLAAKIRADREARAREAQEKTEAKTWRERAEAAEAKLSKHAKSDVVSDTVGWAEAMGLEPEEIAAVGQNLLYSLRPDKADAEVRIRLMEAKQVRERKLSETKAAEAQKAAERAQVETVHNSYIEALASSVEALPQGGTTFPNSEAWFSENREAYVQSLYATANNLADYARARGQQADLSFAFVARVLEDDLSSRFSKLPSRGAAPVEAKPAEGAGKQPEVIVTNKDLGGGSPPRPPATTEDERIKRAMEVAFRTK